MTKLDENLVRKISLDRDEPGWLFDMRMHAFLTWKKMTEPHWADIDYAPIDYDTLNYFNNPKPIDNSDLAATYEKMGLPESEKKALLGMATDTIIDSRSVHTSYMAELEKHGIIFLPMGMAIEKYPDLVRKYLGSVIPPNDNFFAALNMAVFSDGTFVYIPKDTKCPIDLASYFRLETANMGQFERTLIIADSGAQLSYMEGCSAPRRTKHQLHSGAVEVILKPGAEVKYATVQNWAHNIYNFVTKRAHVEEDAKMYWTQIEAGSAKTWKYPSSILKGENAFSDFYSLSITRDEQQADTGTRMIHNAPNTKSNIVSLGVAMGNSRQTFRSVVLFKNIGCANATNCDSKIIGNKATANTLPKFKIISTTNHQPLTMYSHEAKTGPLDASALYYLALGGIDEAEGSALLVSGLATPVLQRLPMEFLVESKQLIQLAMT